MDELKFTQMYIRKDTLREINIMATLKAITMRNLVEEDIELKKIPPNRPCGRF